MASGSVELNSIVPEVAVPPVAGKVGDQLLRALSSERRTRLLELALLNGFQNLDVFQEQMELVRSYATERTRITTQ